MCKRGFRLSNALKYDANGNVWLDGYNKSAYILNSIGMPEHIALYSEVPSKLSPIDVDQETVYDEEFANIRMTPAPVRAVKKESVGVPAEPVRKAPPPSITRDVILSGSNPVAILKFRGESAVVSVGQEIWGVTVKEIGATSVTLVYKDGEFTLTGN